MNYIITAAQLEDLKRFAADLADGQLDGEQQTSIAHNLEAMVFTCESMPADEDPEDDEMVTEDDENEE